jgi:small subunit ribosomal protein S14
MPKTSAIERNKKRIRLVAQHKVKRAELKAILANPDTNDEAFFAAQKKLAKLPRNSAQVRIKNRCSLSGRELSSASSVYRVSLSVSLRSLEKSPA